MAIIFGGDSSGLSTTGGTMAGNIAMGGNKITGAGAGTANGELVRYDEWIKNRHVSLAFAFTNAAGITSGTMLTGAESTPRYWMPRVGAIGSHVWTQLATGMQMAWASGTLGATNSLRDGTVGAPRIVQGLSAPMRPQIGQTSRFSCRVTCDAPANITSGSLRGGVYRFARVAGIDTGIDEWYGVEVRYTSASVSIYLVSTAVSSSADIANASGLALGDYDVRLNWSETGLISADYKAAADSSWTALGSFPEENRTYDSIVAAMPCASAVLSSATTITVTQLALAVG